LKANARADGPVPVPSPPSLAERLAEAQRAAEGPARRVGELEGALADALDRKDYTAAAGLKDELAEARQEAAITDAAVTGLRTAIAEIGRLQAEDNRAIQEQQQRDAAQRRLGEMLRLEAEALGELDAAVENFWAAVRAAKNLLLSAKSLELRVGQVRAEAHLARVALGEAEPVSFALPAPNKASVLSEYYAVVRAIEAWAP
jgi:hypothetical protein